MTADDLIERHARTGPICAAECRRALFFLRPPLPARRKPCPEGVSPEAALYFPSYRLALVKPKWSVPERRRRTVNSPAALMRVTLLTERQWILRWTRNQPIRA